MSKDDPTAPTGLTAIYGQTLANVTLPDGWTWADSTQSVGNVVDPAATFKANFAGDDNHSAASNVDVTVTVGKAEITPTVTLEGWTAGATANTPTVTGNTGNGEVTYQYKVKDAADDTYSADVPTAVGEYTVKATIAETANSSRGEATADFTISAVPIVPIILPPATPAPTTVTVPVSGEDATVNVSVSVSGDSATVQDADLDTVLSETADTGTVTIDVSVLDTEITEAVIPAAMVEKIADAVADANNDADGLEVKLTTGSVTFDAEALEAIADQMTGSDLKLNLDGVQVTELTSAQQEAVADIEVEVVLDAYLTSNGQRISDFGGGTATVKVPYELKAGQIGEGLTVWYVASDGTRTAVEASYDGENIVFAVPHFSNYVIAYDADKAAEANLLVAFRDLSADAWYADGVKYAIKNKIMDGMGDGVFAPNGSTTRAQLAQILYNMEGKPAASAALNFTDVVTTNWYADALRWAVANGVMDGYGDGTFGPNDALTREQLVTILYRYAKLKNVDVSVGEDTNILSYDDAFSVSDWAMAAMQWAVGSGAVGGKTATTLNPKDSATRAEIATIMMRYQTEIAK